MYSCHRRYIEFPAFDLLAYSQFSENKSGVSVCQQTKQSAELYRSIKAQTGTVYKLAAEKFTNAPTLSEIAGDIINGEKNKNEVLKHPNSGRRSASIF